MSSASALEGGAESVSDLLEFVGFQLDGEAYALPVERIREISRVGAITPMPHVPPAVIGVVSLRGEIVQVVDARRRLGLGPATASKAQRVLVLQGVDGGVAALLVDAVTDVLRVSESELKPPPSGSSEFVWALTMRGDTFVSLMDPERMIQVASHV